MLVDRRLSLLILSAISLALVVNLVVNIAQTSIYSGFYQAERAKVVTKLVTAAATTTTTTKTETTSPAPAESLRMFLEMTEEENMRKFREQGLPLLLSITASLAIAISSFMLVKRFLA